MGKGALARRRTVRGLIRVAIYLRVSTAQQLEGYGLKVQEDQCRAWIAYALRGVNHTVVDVYVDGGISGKLANREDLDRMTVDARLDDFTFEQKADLIDLLDVHVQIAGKGKPRHKGLVDPITEWHRGTGITVPAAVTDEMWAEARGILSGNRQWRDPRDGFEVMLEKLREGRAWSEYSGSERIGGRSYGALYRRVTHWFGSGEYERAQRP
ncbi:recombinase family protein [Streptomyces noursei]|uniref:recombinase family protein n=1 Tax=Streptomyces noursei TaxID=1971 RepID=UPI0023B7DF75|nr:recombinase family protein [Streptomyces noursei]